LESQKAIPQRTGKLVMIAMNANRSIDAKIIRDFYGISPAIPDLWEQQIAKSSPGFFRFESNLVCYGESTSGTSHDFRGISKFNASSAITSAGTCLPFSFSEVIENLRRERYVKHLLNGDRAIGRNLLVWKAYYAVREMLPVGIRRPLQKAYFKGWEELPFPNWPVDFTADLLHEELLKLVMKAQGVGKIPFIWFWPDGASACTILTHDVETAAGRDFSSKLMDIDDSRGFKASFQVIPESRYEVPQSYWDEIRSRGFEFNVHDINHDGYLFHSKSEFERRARQINHYARKFGARGFRAGSMYRNVEWFKLFEFAYDMSVPNVAHLEPQRGGCCTVMPYFVGDILELPLTTVQDYSVFNILEQYSIELWKKQIELIRNRNGLISFLSHPDYLIDLKARGVYESLLAHIRDLCDRHNVWHALPGDLDSWWRARNSMNLVRVNNEWQVQGPESHRARIAYATLEGERIVYSVENVPVHSHQPHRSIA
jgi:hypothetical protein